MGVERAVHVHPVSAATQQIGQAVLIAPAPVIDCCA